jgi:hypothetical protein
MKTEEKIIKYFDGQLTSDEKISFEKELDSSEELKKEFQKYLLVSEKVNQQKSAKLNPDYVNSILPEFHRKISEQKSNSFRKNLSYALSFVLVIIIGVFAIKLFTNNSSKTSDDIEKFTQSLNDDQKLNLLEDLSSTDDVYSMVSGKELIGMLQKDLVVNSEVLDNYGIGYQDILGSLTEKEADKIYNEILKQNILKEVPL